MKRQQINKIKTGQLIKNKIMESSISIESIAWQLNFTSPRVIYEWIKGRKIPSLETAYNLSLILNCTIDEIICFEPMN